MTIGERMGGPAQRDVVMDLVERCELEEIRITRTTFAPPLLDCAKEGTRPQLTDLARFIAGALPVSDHLVAGLREQLGRLRVAVFYEAKKRSTSELRRLTLRVHNAAKFLRTFPENGQLPISKMRKAKKKADILLEFLENLDLQSYIFGAEPAIIPNADLIAEALTVIFKRACAADIRKNGAPKKQKDIQVPYWDQFVSGMIYTADLTGNEDGSKRSHIRSIKKRMTPLPEEGRRQSDRANKRDQDSETFSSLLLCAVIVGVAYSEVSTGGRWSKSGLTFPKNASEACEIVWRAVGCKGHNDDYAEGAEFKVYPCWDGWIKSARRTSSDQLIDDVRFSFRKPPYFFEKSPRP
jgi:hypothetical protein